MWEVFKIAKRVETGRGRATILEPVLRVGLTGGIGAGKSAVAQRLAHHGAVIIDADLLAREVVAEWSRFRGQDVQD